MRHLLGIVLAVVTAAAVFFGGSWGFLKLLLSPTRSSALLPGSASLIHNHAVLEGVGALAGVGLVIGIMIAAPRISPLASGLPGLAMLAWTALYLFDAPRAAQYIPLKTQNYGAGFQDLLIDGVLALAGLAMIIPLFVPSRWRRAPFAPQPVAYDAAAAPYSASQETQTMGGSGGLLSDWAETRPQPQADPGGSQAPWGPPDQGSPGGSAGTGYGS